MNEQDSRTAKHEAGMGATSGTVGAGRRNPNEPASTRLPRLLALVPWLLARPGVAAEADPSSASARLSP